DWWTGWACWPERRSPLRPGTLRLGEGERRGHAQQQRGQRGIAGDEVLGHQQVGLGPGEGAALFAAVLPRAAVGRDLREELIVADQAHHLAVGVEREPAEHGALAEAVGVAELVQDEGGGGLPRGHGSALLVRELEQHG